MKTNSSRRDFLRLSAAGALGALVLTQTSCKTAPAPPPPPPPVDPKSFGLALQLYTIRDAMATDVPGSLKKVSDIGIKYLELAGYADRKFYGYEPADFKKLVLDLGMDIISSHTQVEAAGITVDNAKIMAEDHAKLGVKYLSSPGLYRKPANPWPTGIKWQLTGTRLAVS
jgi:sugar phosphate isomerase/epimerase